MRHASRWDGAGREAGVPESTRADILWHTTPSVTHPYSMAQIVELHDALERNKADGGRWNKSLATLKLEQREGHVGMSVPQRSPRQRKRVSPCEVNPWIEEPKFWCSWQDSNPGPLGS